MGRKRIAGRWSVIAAASMLVLVGCADGADPDDDTADEPGATAPENGDDPGTEIDLVEALERIGGHEPGPAQVVYTVAAPDAPADARMTVAQDPPNRADLIEWDEGEFLVISGDNSAFCTNDDQGWQCFPGDMGGLGMDPESMFPDVYESDEFDESDIDPDSEIRLQTIAGRSAICLTVPETEDGTTDVEACFDEQTGILLRATGTEPEGTFTIEAVEFSDPDPDIFVPPAEITELPG